MKTGVRYFGKPRDRLFFAGVAAVVGKAEGDAGAVGVKVRVWQERKRDGPRYARAGGVTGRKSGELLGSLPLPEP